MAEGAHLVAVMPPGRSRWSGRVLAALCLWLGLVAFGLAALMAVERSAEPGFDFRYFWLAGQIWADGISPYGSTFTDAGARLIAEGHVPLIWPYPPNLWLPTLLLAPFDLQTAWHLWLCLDLAALAAASALLAFGLPSGQLPGGGGWLALRLTRLEVFGLHVALMATIETIQLSLYVGQASIFLYLGAALLVTGLAEGRGGRAVAGLTILCLKPQIGAVVMLALMISGRGGLRLAVRTVVVCTLLTIPPMLAKPTVILDWLQSVGNYDGVAFANLPLAMSGIRHLAWAAVGLDMGNLAAMAVTLIVGAAIALHRRRPVSPEYRESGLAAGDQAVIALLVVLALAPLHIYDFTLFGVVVLTLAGSRGFGLVLGLLGAALCLRPSDLQIWFVNGGPVSLFPGTTLATWGALLMLVAALVPRGAAGDSGWGRA
ncbi:glycosyltransferase 87 family protein [Albidovulum sp.]|uniref:glycosyltransferase 87 family protein n=1 Tax=Albidovulum sp. TaxID=1872424 RepID=UPI0039B93CFD